MPINKTDGQGKRTDKDTGEVEDIKYNYVVYTSDQDVIDNVTDFYIDYNRILKIDARNKACAPKQSEEQKAQAKARGRQMRELFAKVKANPALALELGIDVE